MELLLEQCDHNLSDEPCEECTPKKEKEDTFEISDYDYSKRLWF